jgi:hypothetical protein
MGCSEQGGKLQPPVPPPAQRKKVASAKPKSKLIHGFRQVFAVLAIDPNCPIQDVESALFATEKRAFPS